MSCLAEARAVSPDGNCDSRRPAGCLLLLLRAFVKEAHRVFVPLPT